MFVRELKSHILKAADSFYAVSIVGPRQSGKTTLLKHTFPTHVYISLEDPDTKALIANDPKGFFADPNTKWIIDEAQEHPDYFHICKALSITIKSTVRLSYQVRKTFY